MAIEASSLFELNALLNADFNAFLAAFLTGSIHDVIHIAVVFETVLVGILFRGAEVGNFSGFEEVVEDFFLEGLGAIAQFCQVFEQIEPLVEVGGELSECLGEFGQFDVDEFEFVVENFAVLILELDDVEESFLVFMVVKNKI